MRDKRDPRKLGERMLDLQDDAVVPHTLRQVQDSYLLLVPDYRDETTIEKYGDPRLLPSTLPN